MPSDVLCPECAAKIKFNHPPFCPICSRYLPPYFERVQCHSCLHLKPYFNFAWGCCLYEEPLRSLIHSYKYNNKILLTPLFTRLMVQFLNSYNLDIKQFDMIMPIPLHFIKLKERNYNQSYHLAKEISRNYGIALMPGNLIKHKSTSSQAALSVKERWTNIQDTFRIKHPQDVKGKNILVIDDILTTGATVSEAAKVLKQCGAQTVGVLTLAIVEEI